MTQCHFWFCLQAETEVEFGTTEEYKMAKEILEKTVLEDWELMYLVEVNHSDKQIK